MGGDDLMARLRTLAGELLVPALLLGYATHYYLEVRALPRPETNLLLIEPVYFILLGCCLLFGIGRILVAFRATQHEDLGTEQVGGRLDFWKSASFVGLTLLYAVLIPVVGFVVITIIYIVLLSLTLGVRSLAALTITPVAVVALLYMGMELWLNLPLPKGMFL